MTPTPAQYRRDCLETFRARLLGSRHGRAGRLRASPFRATTPLRLLSAYRSGLVAGFRGGLIAARNRTASRLAARAA